MTCPPVGDNPTKVGLIPHTFTRTGEESRKAPEEGLAAHQVVGVVTAHLACDG